MHRFWADFCGKLWLNDRILCYHTGNQEHAATEGHTVQQVHACVYGFSDFGKPITHDIKTK